MTDIHGASLRALEKDSIASFMAAQSRFFKGKVLDFGSGKMPYRGVIEQAGAEYHPYDRIAHPASTATTDVGRDEPLSERAAWDVIVMNQVIQYIIEPISLLYSFRQALKPGGHLVMTYPTNWPEVESADLNRFTREGMTRILRYTGFTIETHEMRASIKIPEFELALGYGVVAKT